MALYYVRWYAPGRRAPLFRDFHNKGEADKFRQRLPYLSEPPTCYPEPRK